MHIDFTLFKVSFRRYPQSFRTNTYYLFEWSTLDFKFLPYYYNEVGGYCISWLGFTFLKAIG